MLLIELELKIKDKTATKEDLFDYFQVKNMDGLESLLTYKFSNVDINTEFLYQGFEYIYKQRIDTGFNPIQEKFMFLAVACKSLYNFETDEFTAMADINGVFNTLMLIENIISSKDEFVFYKKLYNEYINNKEGIYAVSENFINRLVLKIDEVIGKVDIKQLSELMEEFNKGAANLKQ